MGPAARILGWRSGQPTLIRWLEALAMFGAALTVRFSLGTLYGAIPFVSFYPAIMLSALLLGWKEASFVLLLSISAGWYFFLPANQTLLPVGWILVGILNIAIIIALKALAKALDEANERQRLLFQELQHRVANTLQMTIGTLDLVRNRMSRDPAGAIKLLDNAIDRMAASADIHRRLHDPVIFLNGLQPMLAEVVSSVFDPSSVALKLDIEEFDLSLDQKSLIAMLVIEVANNTMKHVFQRNLGTCFEVTLRALPGHRAELKIRDDGPGTTGSGDDAAAVPKLGMRILQGLTDQIGGSLCIDLSRGREVIIGFPRAR
jgi:two-component sensor histidine kinase